MLNEQEASDIRSTLERLRDQARNSALLVDFMVHDERAVLTEAVVPDFSVGDFLVFDRKRHPEFNLC